MGNRRPDELSNDQLIHCLQQLLGGKGPPAECFAILYEVARRHADAYHRQPLKPPP